MAAIKGTRKMGGTAPKPTPKAKNVNTTVKPFEQTAAGKAAWSKLNASQKDAVRYFDYYQNEKRGLSQKEELLDLRRREDGKLYNANNKYPVGAVRNYIEQRRVADAMYKRRQAATSAPAAAKAVKGAKVNNYGGRPSSSARKRSRGD